MDTNRQVTAIDVMAQQGSNRVWVSVFRTQGTQETCNVHNTTIQRAVQMQVAAVMVGISRSAAHTEIIRF